MSAYLNGRDVSVSVDFNGVTAIDDHLSWDSDNPVENRVITQAIFNGGIFWPTSFEQVHKILINGLAELAFPVGSILKVTDADTGNVLRWMVVDYNHPQRDETDPSFRSPTVTLLLDDVYSKADRSALTLQYDAGEALYYCAEALEAGTYHFVNEYAENQIAAGTYQFTLAQNVPKGGQICLKSANTTKPLTGTQVTTYASVGADSPLEDDVAITEGDGGTLLGTTSGATATENMNNFTRVLFGSSNYAQSAMRQWLNSAGAAGEVWTPQTVFDRPPAWAKTQAGFLHGLPEDFLAYVQTASIPCAGNSVFEVDSLDGTTCKKDTVYTVKDRFFLPSQPEMYGTYDNNAVRDGTIYRLWNEVGASIPKTVQDLLNTARRYALRSNNRWTPTAAKIVNEEGTVATAYANMDTYAVAPVCVIG